jgi:hypothetical protein
MSIDKFHFISKGENPSDVAHKFKSDEPLPERRLDAWHGEGTHTIYEMQAGVEHLYIFEDGATAAEVFERWRRQPVEKIVLTLKGIAQDWVGRLPLGTKPGDGCDMDVSWDGCYDTDGDPNGPAQWPVLCGQPVAGQWRERRLCQKHLEGCLESTSGISEASSNDL